MTWLEDESGVKFCFPCEENEVFAIREVLMVKGETGEFTEFVHLKNKVRDSGMDSRRKLGSYLWGVMVETMILNSPNDIWWRVESIPLTMSMWVDSVPRFI